MYINKSTLEGVSGFTAFSNYYWSSTECDYNNAWDQDFNDGVQASAISTAQTMCVQFELFNYLQFNRLQSHSLI